MAVFVYPTSIELREIEQEILPRLTLNDPLFDPTNGIFPIETVDQHDLAWEQQDNYRGLQQVRGLDGAFPRVKKVGVSRYAASPGVYGEFIDFDEQELTRRRQIGSFDTPVSLDDLVMGAQNQLLHRRIMRQRQIAWTLLMTGTFSVAGPTGAVLHTDTYSPQTYTAGITWATSATAVPLGNLRAVNLLGPARGAQFGSGAKIYLNQTTWNTLVGNTNASDLSGRLTNVANNIRSQNRINEIAMGENLPSFVVYDEGYVNDSGTFVKFIPDNKAALVGQRPNNAPVGAYRMTRNASNPGMAPGPFTYVRDSMEQGEPPRRVDVFDGHNGGPVIYWPGSIVVMTV